MARRNQLGITFMSVLRLDHYNLRADSVLIERLRIFYCDVVGLELGFRPPLKSTGYWLYAGEKDVLHLSQATPNEIRKSYDGQSTFDHIAFSCSDLKSVEFQLQDKDIHYKRSDVPQSGAVQLFLMTLPAIKLN